MNGYGNNFINGGMPQYQQNAAYPQQNAAYPQQEQPRATLMPYTQVVAAWVRSCGMAADMALDPNKIAFMVDDEHNKIYVKRSDQFGRQSPVRTYDYVAPPPDKPAVDMSGYVTAEQFGGFVVGTGIIVAVPSICGCSNVAVENIGAEPITISNGVIKFDTAGVRRVSCGCCG